MKASNAASASFLSRGHPDLLERTLGLRLLALGQLVQDIGGLVHPTALAARPRPHVHQQALRGLIEPGLHMDAVDPEVNVAFDRETALAPTRMLVRAGILAKRCDQRLLESAVEMPFR
jgi:hypothetical protein